MLLSHKVSPWCRLHDQISIDSLPDSILLKIFSFLDVRALCRCAQVQKSTCTCTCHVLAFAYKQNGHLMHSLYIPLGVSEVASYLPDSLPLATPLSNAGDGGGGR